MENQDKKRHLHIGALVLVVVIVLILLRVNLEKAINTPQFQSNVSYIEKEASLLFNKMKVFFNLSVPLNIDQTTLEKKVQPNRIKDYFGVPSEDKINQLSSPVSN